MIVMEEWTYETAPDIDKSLMEKLRGFPREPDLLVYCFRSITMLAIRFWLKVYHRFEIIGKENIPTKESFVLVANHASHLDTLMILSLLPLKVLHRTFPAAAADCGVSGGYHPPH